MLPVKPQEDVRVRLRRIEGQIRGIARMIDEDRSCVDVLTQVSSAREALRGVARVLLGRRLERYANALPGPGGSDEAMALLKEISRFAGWE